MGQTVPGAAPALRPIPTPSIRAMFTERRTYLRPINDDGTKFETPAMGRNRVIAHQRFLWEQQVGRNLNDDEEMELEELLDLIIDREVSMSGRVRWMGGTDIIKKRASAAFNCSFTEIQTPADVTDVFWLLLQGCGVGFKPVTGLMCGLPDTITNVLYVASTRTDKGGAEDTTSIIDYEASTWTIKFGDSAKGWAKGVGSLLANKPRVKTLIIDFSELRPGGRRLKGYGWLSSGWEPFKKGIEIIINVLRERGMALLTNIDIGDIATALGTVLSSRRSAEIWLVDDTDPEVNEFADCKVNRWENGKGHREMSNNSVLFWTKPERSTIINLLKRILVGGEPGFINAAEAKRRAPEFVGANPCAEILLPSKGFCNLVQVVWSRFNGRFEELLRAQFIAGRANYRQTCVSMRDGVLQLQWNDNQKLLRLCGVSPTGYVAWEHAGVPVKLQEVAAAAISGTDSMADELGLPRARRVTQVQPAGTVSKSLGNEGDEIHEGAHCAMSRYIINNINFSSIDPMLDRLRSAGYRVRVNPGDPTGTIVAFPVAYAASPMFTQRKVEIDGVEQTMEINEETALDQLERYRCLMENYVQHNCSITVSFDEHEIEEMADWFMDHWDSFVGVSFLKRNNPLATAEDLGFLYLPQECVTREAYEAYMAELSPVSLDDDTGEDLLDMGECATGACPIR